MSSIAQFLVIDDHPDHRFLLTKTLIRKYPGALIQECQDSSAALVAVKRPGLTAVIVHRSSDVEGVPLVAMLRQENPTVPILSSRSNLRSKICPIDENSHCDRGFLPDMLLNSAAR